MRLEGWEQRLDAVLESARHKPYVLGRHDCLRVACAAYEAITGINHWPRFCGTYQSKLESLRAIREVARDFSAAITRVTETQPIAMPFARRGDIALYKDARGEHLGVCVGQFVAVLGPQGMLFVRRNDSGLLRAWPVD